MNTLTQRIKNGRLLKKNGSWMYCDSCHKTVGYLCYSTYQSFKFTFTCQCGNKGSFLLSYPSEKATQLANSDLRLIKNRLCCPVDNSPLFSAVDKNLETSSYTVTCKKCLNTFIKK